MRALRCVCCCLRAAPFSPVDSLLLIRSYLGYRLIDSLCRCSRHRALRRPPARRYRKDKEHLTKKDLVFACCMIVAHNAVEQDMASRVARTEDVQAARPIGGGQLVIFTSASRTTSRTDRACALLASPCGLWVANLFSVHDATHTHTRHLLLPFPLSLSPACSLARSD